MLVAPEGRISHSLELLPFGTGAVRMAQAAEVPVIPSAAWGTHRVLTAGRPLNMRAAFGLPISCVFAPPMHVLDADPDDATARLQDVTAQLLERMVREYAGGTPEGAPWVPQRYGGSAPAEPASG